MRLGILVNSDRNLQSVVGLTAAAAMKNHQVTLFVMDEGTRLLEDASFVALVENGNVAMSYCDHSAQELGVATSGLPEKIERSSQYNNAVMNHHADKVLVL